MIYRLVFAASLGGALIVASTAWGDTYQREARTWDTRSLALLVPPKPHNYSPVKPVSGYGSCGQFCNDIDIGNFDCDESERPVWDDEGNCECEPFPECD